MKNLTLLFLLLAAFPLSNVAQITQSANLHLDAPQLQQVELWMNDGSVRHQANTLAIPIPLTGPAPFLAWSVVWTAPEWSDNNRLTVTFDGNEKENLPVQVKPDEHADGRNGKFISNLYFADKSARNFRLRYTGDVKIGEVEIHFFNPGESESPARPGVQPANDRSACPCPQPDYQGRLDWCPNGNCPTDPTPQTTTVTHLIVHHAAGTNNSNDWAAVVRSIWDFHVNVNGWDDVGYNWLIDPNGVLYEGRGDNRLGAHFCGTNGGTMGVCVMGDYTLVPPTAEAVSTLQNLLTWKACDASIDPLGSAFHNSSGLTLKRISGHRDGCATSCPGNSFYPMFDNIRNSVHCQIENGCMGGFVPAPADLQASVVNSNQIKLTWQDNSLGEKGYLLERASGSPVNFFQLADLPPNTFTYTDNGVFANMDYYYRLKAVDDCFESDYSNEAFATTVTSSQNAPEAEANRLTLQPNPASDFIRIRLENDWMGQVHLSLTDLFGRRLHEAVVLEKNTDLFETVMSLEAAPAGMFHLKISIGQRHLSKYFIKQ
jgi:hypothetical protein